MKTALLPFLIIINFQTSHSFLFGLVGNSKHMIARSISLLARNHHCSEKIFDLEPLPHLTVILPSFNEESRIGSTIKTYRNYLQTSPIWGNKKCSCDILVVDDGSTDETIQVIRDLATEGDDDDGYISVEIRYVSLMQNEGKGAAIERGLIEIEYQNQIQMQLDEVNNETSIVLVADADGSGDIKSLEDMMEALISIISAPSHGIRGEYSGSYSWHKPGLVVGNRGYQGVSLKRAITRWAFRTVVKLFCGNLNVGDTQCGFKLMTVTAGSCLYRQLNLKRWSHDVEVLLRAKQMGIPVTETTVGWKDMPGSKLATTLFGTIKISSVMLLEVLFMRLGYLFGILETPCSKLEYSGQQE